MENVRLREEFFSGLPDKRAVFASSGLQGGITRQCLE